MAEKSYFNIEIKADSDADEGSFIGNLSTYGNVDYGGDVVEKGAFDSSLSRKGNVYPLLWQHDQTKPIGQLQIIGTEDALTIKAKLNLEVSKAKEAYALLKAGDISGLSMGYWPTKFSYDQDGIRHLTEVELFEGSVVTFPMDPEAQVTRVKTMTENDKKPDLDEIIEGAIDDAMVDSFKTAIKAAVRRCLKAMEDAPVEDPDKDPESAEEKEDENDEECKSLLREINAKLDKFKH